MLCPQASVKPLQSCSSPRPGRLPSIRSLWGSTWDPPRNRLIQVQSHPGDPQPLTAACWDTTPPPSPLAQPSLAAAVAQQAGYGDKLVSEVPSEVTIALAEMGGGDGPEPPRLPPGAAESEEMEELGAGEPA